MELWRKLSFSLMALGGIGLAAHLYNKPHSSVVPHSFPETFVGLERVGLSNSNDNESAAAFCWKSVLASEPHPNDHGQAWLSLVPANGSLPLIWNVTSDLLKTPASLPPSERSRRVTFIGTYHGGLAPASVEYEIGPPGKPLNAGNIPPTTTISWGYIDTDGQWAIPPRYKEASPFVGDIAVVATEEGQLRLIDRAGSELATLPVASKFAFRKPITAGIKLTRLGHWVWIDHQPWYSITQDGIGEGEPTQIFDGSKLVPLPGVNPIPSIDGELWLVHTSTGTRLWKPDSGFVEVASNITPALPLSSNLFLSDSQTGQSTALYAIDGRLIADPAPILKALTPTRFIACDSGASDSLFDWHSSARTVGPDLPGHRCGILDEKGQWWAPPKYQMIDLWNTHEVRLQSGSHACMVDLQSPNAQNCTLSPSGSKPVPLVNLDRLPRLYGYQGRDDQIVLPYQFSNAHPFTDHIAEISDQYGFPGLVDIAGQWLTPRPNGDLLSEAHVRAAIAQQPYRYRKQTGTGLIDRSGNWAVPPVFASISRYADGSLWACGYALGGGCANCKHLDVHGQLLPPTSDHIVNDSDAPPESEDQPGRTSKSELVSTEGTTASSQPVAIAQNGRWGFQDRKGRWIVEPQFDDAEDFSDGIAFAGIRSAWSEGDAKKIIWGIIGLRGDWIIRPQFEAINPFVGDVAVVKDTELWGLIDRKGRWLSKPEFELVNPFVGDVALARKDSLWGLIGRNGNWLAKPEYLAISDFVGDVAIATKPGGAQCQLFKNGKCIGEDGVEIVARSNDIYMVVRTTGEREQLYGYLSSDGKWAIRPVFYRASSFYHDFAVVQAALPSLSDELRLRTITTEIQYLPSAKMYAVKAEQPGITEASEGRYALVDATGRWLLPRKSSAFSFLGIR